MEPITNQAHVTFSYEGRDTTITNDSNTITHTFKERYSIALEKTATQDCFRAGDTITYFLHITNNGCGCLGTFYVTDNLGGEGYLTYVEGSARIFVNGSMSEITPTEVSPLEFEISERLERDEELILQYNVTVSDDIPSEVTEIVNEACVRAYPCGCNCENGRNTNCVSECTTHTLEKCEFAEVLITKASTSDNVCCDDEFDYLITLTNTGTVDATNVVVTDQLPTAFNTTEIHMENNGNHYKFDASEYTIDDANFLTLPNETGTAILVPALAPGVDNSTRIRIHGHM